MRDKMKILGRGLVTLLVILAILFIFFLTFSLVRRLVSTRDELIDKDSNILTIDSSGDIKYTDASGLFDYSDNKVDQIVRAQRPGVTIEELENKIQENNVQIYPYIQDKVEDVRAEADGIYVKKQDFADFKGTDGELEKFFLKKSTPYSANVSRASGSSAALFNFS